MSESRAHHKWTPIVDLSNSDLEAASEELPHILSVWSERRQELSSRQLEEFNERLHREWAIETGIIERIYSIDEGVTKLLIEHGIDASFISHDDSNGKSPEQITGIIKDHQEAVEGLFEFVRQERTLSTSFIKDVHHLMTRKQEHADGVDQFGKPTKIPLRHGDYKQRPNNPTRSDGSIHEYCPPEHVAAEMDRLISIHADHRELGIQPDLSAAWLHHRFAQIHPFQDGNGRVARALASLIFIQEGWFPLVVTRRDRQKYISALERADGGELSPLVEQFGSIQKRAFLSGLSLVEEIMREDARVEQILDAIGDEWNRRDKGHRSEMEMARNTADRLRRVATTKLEEVKAGLQSRISSNLQIYVDSEADDVEQRHWFRFQVIETAKELDYFANLREFHSWVKAAFVTPSTRSEILLSFHAVGRDYRGLIGASMSFYRRQQADADGKEQRIADLQTVSEDLFQLTYLDDPEITIIRFNSWLEKALVMGLDLWRRSE